MGKITGFLEFERQDRPLDPVEERTQHYREFAQPLSEEELRRQGSRCMDCGTPFCHPGCPVDNMIPEWNDAVYRDRWQRALVLLHSTNNFPDFTGRICPAPCEMACTLNLVDKPVSIKTLEHAIVERGWKENWIKPELPTHRTGKRVAIVGSGPAGLACAQQLARVGHAVHVFEKQARLGGLLRYGIPDFKLEKWVIDRRLGQLRGEGVEFHPNTHIGKTIQAGQLIDRFDAVVLAIGSEHSRDLKAPGRELSGIHFAMDYLAQSNRRVARQHEWEEVIDARGKRVVVIGGGDTGSDCIGTAHRQGATEVVQLEIMPEPPLREEKLTTWPHWPLRFRTSSSQEEGAIREFAVSTQAFLGQAGKLTALQMARVNWAGGGATRRMEIVPGSEFRIDADLVFLAMGFEHPRHEDIVIPLSLDLDPRGNIKADHLTFRASSDKVFTTGDARRGQSLVVWAIREGRHCAAAVDTFLMGATRLPR